MAAMLHAARLLPAALSGTKRPFTAARCQWLRAEMKIIATLLEQVVIEEIPRAGTAAAAFAFP